MTNIPSFIVRNPDVTMSEIRSQMEALLGRQIRPAQFEQLVLQIICFRETLLLERFNAGMAQLLYQFSKAPILDYVAALVAVERLPASRAGCMIKFSLVMGHTSVVIPAGTRVATAERQFEFETTESVTVPVGTYSIEILATARQAGTGANGYAPGKINVILDPLAFVSAAVNTTETGGGADIESDDSLRDRIRLAPHQYTTAGSRQSYLFHAKGANPAIIDVSVNSSIPGVVDIVPLTSGGNYVQVIDDIYRACSAETVRPLCDTVIVSQPTEIHYDISVELILFTGADITSVETQVNTILQRFATSKSNRLGLDIVRSHISQICRIADVYDVRVVNPSFSSGNVIVEFDEVPICDSITVTVTGLNAG